MYIPTDYVPGYEQACALDAELASRYIAHTTIGDPDGDALMELLTPFGRQDTERILRASSERDREALRGVPSNRPRSLRKARNRTRLA